MAIAKIDSISYYTNEYTEDVSLYGAFGANYDGLPSLETIVNWANGDYSDIAEQSGLLLKTRRYFTRNKNVSLDKLVAPNAERGMGWDVGVSTPKDVSILWALLDDPNTIDAIWAMHQASTGVAAQYLRDHATVARVMVDGVKTVRKVEPLMVGIQHSLNRNLEPHLHSHPLVSRSLNAHAAGLRPAQTVYRGQRVDLSSVCRR